MTDSETADVTAQAQALLEPGFEFCFELRAAVDEALPLGGALEGEGLHFARITGGTFDGPRLRGRVLAGGGDWWHGRGLVVRLDARYVIEAEVSAGRAIGASSRKEGDGKAVHRFVSVWFRTPPRSC